MKELSTEEKAKRFDEALAMAKECITYIPDEAVNKYMLNMFPELKESEGEKTRKELIAFLKENYETGRADETWSSSGLERWIAWLEKQGNNADKVEPKFKVGDWVTIKQ